MSVSLTLGATTLALPDTLAWSDELDWTPQVQSSEYSLTGALIVETATKLAGRPIELSGRAATHRALILSLFDWLSTSEPLMLHWRGTDYRVTWNHAAGPLVARPLLADLADPDPTDLYWLELRFLEV